MRKDNVFFFILYKNYMYNGKIHFFIIGSEAFYNLFFINVVLNAFYKFLSSLGNKFVNFGKLDCT